MGRKDDKFLTGRPVSTKNEGITMEVRLNVRNIDLRDAQEKVDDNLRRMRNMSRKAVLAYVGLLGMAYDKSISLFEQSKTTLEQAEDRGEALESAANQRVQEMRKQAETRLRDVEVRVENVQGKVKSRIQRAEGKVEYDVEAQVQQMIDRLGIPSRERINKLSAEIEALSKKIDQQLAAQQQTVAPPVAGYEKLTAREIVALLDTMTVNEWISIKHYEEAHENRVTVVREVNRRLQAMPILGYDELTVEEVQAQLPNLTIEQLEFLAQYEATRQNRVTLRQAIKQEHEARREAVA
jgi:poly(hydroxyalkanoate) granule-associated protein